MGNQVCEGKDFNPANIPISSFSELSDKDAPHHNYAFQ